MLLPRRLDVTSMRAIRKIDQCFSRNRSILRERRSIQFLPESRPDISWQRFHDADSSVRIADVIYREIYGYTRLIARRRAIGAYSFFGAWKRAPVPTRKSPRRLFFFPSLPRRAALLRRVSPENIFSFFRSAYARPFLWGRGCLRRRRPSVCAGCIRVGEVRDPRVITGLSRGTYINPSSPSTYISLPDVAQELVEFSRATIRRETIRSLAVEKSLLFAHFQSFSFSLLSYLR